MYFFSTSTSDYIKSKCPEAYIYFEVLSADAQMHLETTPIATSTDFKLCFKLRDILVLKVCRMFVSLSHTYTLRCASRSHTHTHCDVCLSHTHIHIATSTDFKLCFKLRDILVLKVCRVECVSLSLESRNVCLSLLKVAMCVSLSWKSQCVCERHSTGQ